MSAPAIIRMDYACRSEGINNNLLFTPNLPYN
jgi:hypothetical protein